MSEAGARRTPDGAVLSEIHALARIVDELDYYDLLDVKPDASARAIQLGFHKAARRSHPDVRRHWPADAREAAERVARRVTEAYTVLRNPARRRIYDQRRAAGSLRIQLAEAQAEASAAARTELQARTAQGRRFLLQAEADIQRGDDAAAARSLQMVLTFERDNAAVATRLSELKSRS